MCSYTTISRIKSKFEISKGLARENFFKIKRRNTKISIFSFENSGKSRFQEPDHDFERGNLPEKGGIFC